jgi:hypothetical protein
MVRFDNDESDALAAGSVVGVSVEVSDAAGDVLTAATAVSYTTLAGEGLKDALQNLADKIGGDNGGTSIAPARGDSRQDAPGLGILHVRPINLGKASQGGAYNVALTAPVFTPA